MVGHIVRLKCLKPVINTFKINWISFFPLMVLNLTETCLWLPLALFSCGEKKSNLSGQRVCAGFYDTKEGGTCNWSLFTSIMCRELVNPTLSLYLTTKSKRSIILYRIMQEPYTIWTAVHDSLWNGIHGTFVQAAWSVVAHYSPTMCRKMGVH